MDLHVPKAQARKAVEAAPITLAPTINVSPDPLATKERQEDYDRHVGQILVKAFRERMPDLIIEAKQALREG